MPFDDTMFLKNHVDVLTFFTDEQIRRVTPEINRETYAKGQTVLFKGEISNNFFIVKRGKVQVAYKEGDKNISADLGPGEFFGEMSLLDSTTSNATIRCAEDNTEILILPHDAFKRFLREFPALELTIREKVAERRRLRAGGKPAAAPPPAPPAGDGSPL